MASKKAEKSEIGYAEALAELESILESLEEADVDVDELAERVQRASVLIELCRERIGKAKLRIEEVVSAADSE
jgi:exodeoxyribonuclease VII small subunit